MTNPTQNPAPTSDARKRHNPGAQIEAMRLELLNERAKHAVTARERDTLAAQVAAIRGARANHPSCDRHDEDDPVSCGWKRAVLDIDSVLRDPA